MVRNLDIRGVNLGNWLVLEKWMSPVLFDGTDAEDEYHLARALPQDVYEERIRKHRSEYITEQDFGKIAEMGFNAVRIPIPFFLFGDRTPYIGCMEELDHAFDWAERWGLKVLVDLHTVPGSQNGFDNGGLSGVCRWAGEENEVNFVFSVLERLAERYGKREGLLGIQPLNEPVTTLLLGDKSWKDSGIIDRYPPQTPELAEGSAPITIPFLRNFYVNAYRCVRKHMSKDKFFVIHDAFFIKEWKDFMQEKEFQNVILDTHIYVSTFEWFCEKTLDGYTWALREKYAKYIQEMSQYFPIICGEWCLDNSYARNIHDEESKKAVYRALAEEQLDTWNYGAGYFYWSYKLLNEDADLDCWDLSKCINNGWFPLNAATA